ncbi:MAG: alpha/beta fold hydrolase [Gammaproteobacteria bacterium]|nr:alpha/beta fold hydrolase [Gammaproteobacteria bacterium]
MPLPSVLFIHEAGGGSWEWCVWENIFRQNQFQTYAINLEAADKGLEHTTSADYLNQTKRFAERHQLITPVMVGVGMGGMLALRFAQESQPKAIVLINPLGPQAWIGEELTIPPVVIPWRNEDREWLDDMPSSHPRDEIQERRESGAVLKDLYLKQTTPSVTCPCMVLIGEQHNVAPPETGNELADALNAQVIAYKGTDAIAALLGFEAKAIARQVCAELKLLEA